MAASGSKAERNLRQRTSHKGQLQERGRHFDPQVVDAFLACEDEFAAICSRFQDD